MITHKELQRVLKLTERRSKYLWKLHQVGENKFVLEIQSETPNFWPTIQAWLRFTREYFHEKFEVRVIVHFTKTIYNL